MQDRWSRNFKDRIREKEKVLRVTSEDTGKPFLTTEEAAARLGIKPRTLRDWIDEGAIPRPLKYGRHYVRRPFRRTYIERLRDCLIIRNSTTEYRSLESLKKLVWKAIWGLR
jgi:excisionase family DNA binding protein